MKKKVTILVLGLLVSLTTIQAQTWTQIGADIDGKTTSLYSGESVSLSSDGSIVAIGEPYNSDNGSSAGQVRIYQNNSGTWTQIGQDINGESGGNWFGTSVSLSSDGSIVAIGAYGNDGNGENAGHVRIYQNNSGTWTQIGQDIDGEAAGDYSGKSVSLSSDGSIVAIGAWGNNGNGDGAGHVRIYQNNSGTWTQVGQDIDGEAADDGSGVSVSLSSDGSIVAIGASGNDGNGENAGQVRIYQNNSGTWTQIGQDIDGEAAGDYSGDPVSLNSDGSIVAIGGFGNDGNGNFSGNVRIYQYTSGTWTQIGQDIDGEAAVDASGASVSLSSDGSIVAIGAPYNDGNGEDAGNVRIYQNNSGTWTQVGQDIDGEAADDYSGTSVSLSSDGSIVAIGAPRNDGNGDNVGHVRVYSSQSTEISSLSATNISVYPNPTTGIINFNFVNNNIQKITISDITGKQIYTSSSQLINKSSHQVDLSNFDTGIYILKIQTDKKTFTTKVVKE